MARLLTSRLKVTRGVISVRLHQDKISIGINPSHKWDDIEPVVLQKIISTVFPAESLDGKVQINPLNLTGTQNPVRSGSISVN